MKSTTTDLSALNKKQREAVMSDEKRLLVLAGAGSGKTKTLLQKIIYLIEEEGVNPANILAITFTRSAANEMLDRLILVADETEGYAAILADKNRSNKEKDVERYLFSRRYRWVENLTLKTFHSLCYSIMRNFGVNEFDNKFRIIGDSKVVDDDFVKYAARETSYEVLHKILIHRCESSEYLLDLKRHILDYIVDRIHLDQGKRAALPRDGKYFTTLNGIKVRSKSEQYIADWMFRHNVKFVYEPSVNFGNFNFNPDFYVPEANLYIEHISNKSYPPGTKEKEFRKANKLLVKTFESQTKDTAVFNLVLDRIIRNRLPSDYPFRMALSFEEEFRYYHKEVRDFLRQVIRVIDMIKVENIPADDIFGKSQQDPHERVRDFYKLAIPLFEKYRSYCTNKSYLDFNDMISKTISLFNNHKEVVEKFRNKFEYILIDEFQDVNNLQVSLIQLLLTSKNRLFCVGDDWQSIYGFRGSNVDYIINFSKHFKDAKTIKLNLNYRSTQQIVGASNEVIKNNKFKVKKSLKALKKSKRKIHIYAGRDLGDNINFAVDQVKTLQAKKGYRREDILFLYRRSKMYAQYYERFRKERLRISARTIHGAKGLEAKAVFIIGLTEGYGGFPDIWMEDRIYQVVKESRHDLLMEEERRLFYVALTRAKDDLFLLTEKGNESSFLKEIPKSFIQKGGTPFKSVMEAMNLCPGCQTQVEGGFAFCPHCGERQDLD